MVLPLQISDFAGVWQITRRIDDQKAGLAGHFQGRADISLQTAASVAGAPVYVYSETGQLQYGDQAPLTSTQTYIWRQAAGHISVLFSDGRPFHEITLGVPVTRASHICDPDHYNVSYDFTDWPVWHAVWQVSGPRKDYVMRSRFRRFGDDLRN